MKAGIYHIDCEQGSTLKRDFHLQQSDANMDLTGYSVRMKVKIEADDLDTLLSVSTATGEITIDPDPTTGRFSLVVPATTTDAITSSGVYDIEIESSGGEVTKVLKGDFNLYKTATR